MRRVDRDAPRLLLRRVVDLVVRLRRRQTLLRQNHRDRRRQRRLPVIHVPNRPNVHVRLRPIKLLFGHLRPLTFDKTAEIPPHWSPRPGLNW